MKMLKAAIALGVLAIPALALAHSPVEIPYPTRGACEVALAQDNIFHSFDKVGDGTYDNVGEAMQDMHDHFWCERVGNEWYMFRTPF